MLSPIRSKQFAALSSSHVAAFRSILSNATDVLTGDHNLSKYNEDWLKLHKGHSDICLRPRTTEEVSACIKYCQENNLAVVPQGGNTSLVQGATPVFDEVVLSLEHMNKIISIDTDERSIICEAGAVLQTVSDACAAQDLFVPYDLAAKGSCTIGGNVATNAGGIRMVKYGMVQASVLGLEVVSADGTILNMLTTLRKDNTGYDLKRLYVGSEGTLGIVTKVALALAPLPRSQQVLLHRCANFDDVRHVLRAAYRHLGTALSAFEVWDSACVEVQSLLRGDVPQGVLAPQGSSDLYVLVETHGTEETADVERILAYQETFSEEEPGTPLTTIFAESESQRRMLWSLRENISSALAKRGKVWKFDVTLRAVDWYRLVVDIRAKVEAAGIAEDCVVAGFGHFADGNLHLNVVDATRGAHDAKLQSILYPYVYEEVVRMDGSISAEHGIGLGKRQALRFAKNPHVLEQMRQIKKVLDPKGILNPYKIF